MSTTRACTAGPGSPSAAVTSTPAATVGIRCPYHGWRYALDGRLVDVADADEFTDLPDDLALAPVRVDTWGGFVFVQPRPRRAEPLLEFLDPLPTLLAPYHLEQMRFRSSLTTIIAANWKAVVDAFNEGYHVQGMHPQILPWTDDVSIEYEQFDTHAHYGRLAGARRELRPSPRLGIAPEDVRRGRDPRGLVAGLGGAFLGEERAAVDELLDAQLPPGRRCSTRTSSGGCSCSPPAASTCPGSRPS